MLSEQNRQKLDGIVKQMITNKESDSNIRLVVKDFSTKYNEQPVKKPSFLQTIAIDAKKRTSDIKETIIKGSQGKINPLQSGIRTIGSVAGLAGDVIGSAITKTASAIIPEAIKKEWVTFGKDILQTPIGKEGLKMAANGAEIYQNWKQNNPETAKDLEGAVNIATLFPIGKGAKIAKEGVSEAVSMAGKGISKTAKGLESGAKYATAQLSGLSKNTVEKIIAKPGILQAGENITSESLGDKVKNALVKRIQDLSSTGKEYETIRRYPGKVVIGDTLVPETLSKYGIGLEDGKIKLTAENVPLKQGDINAIQSFINQYGKETELSGNAFMNARKALSNMAGYDADKSDISKLIAKELRSSYDELGKGQLKGLAELDAKYSGEKGALDKIKKEYLQKGIKGAYELKDNALTKIANATNEGRQKILGRLETLIPGIAEDINIYKVMRDIEAVKSQKVGAYAANAFKSGLGGYAVSGGNPIGALVGAILSSPQVIVPILQSYGKFKNISLKFINGIIDKMKAGKQLLNNEKDIINKAIINGADKFNKTVIDKTKNIKPGLTIEDVNKKGLTKSTRGNSYLTTDEIAKIQKETASKVDGKGNVVIKKK